VATWIHRFDQPVAAAGRLRVAVKDAIDVAGLVTTAGCVAVRDTAVPASADAACLAGFRAAGAHLVGKTTLTELCLSPVGLNAALGTPVNPVDPSRIPGGSSSGSAVAVASGEADVGLGTDTGGSVRIPAACCGIVGLKTTWGRISSAGVWPLAPSLDTVGPLARTVDELIAGMRLLAPDWTPVPGPARHIGRLRIAGVDAAVEDLVDAALDAARLTVRAVRLPGWDATNDAFAAIILGELWRAHHALLDVEGVGSAVADDLRAGRAVSTERFDTAMATRKRWQTEVEAALAGVPHLGEGRVQVVPAEVVPSERPTELLERGLEGVVTLVVQGLDLPGLLVGVAEHDLDARHDDDGSCPCEHALRNGWPRRVEHARENRRCLMEQLFFEWKRYRSDGTDRESDSNESAHRILRDYQDFTSMRTSASP